MQISGFGGMAGMAHAAAQGQFAVDPDTGRQLLEPLSQMREAVDSALRMARRLDRPTPLGDLDEALAVSDLNRQVVAGDNQSLVHVLNQFRASLDQVHEAVRQGMANYEQVDNEMREAYERGLAEQRQADRVRGGGGGWVV
jgi:hypothetical protein